MLKRIRNIKLIVNEVDKQNYELKERKELVCQLLKGDYIELLESSDKEILLFNANGEELGKIPERYYEEFSAFLNNEKIEIEAVVHNVKEFKTRLKFTLECNIFYLEDRNKNIPQKIIIQNAVDEKALEAKIDRKYYKIYKEKTESYREDFERRLKLLREQHKYERKPINKQTVILQKQKPTDRENLGCISLYLFILTVVVLFFLIKCN